MQKQIEFKFSKFSIYFDDKWDEQLTFFPTESTEYYDLA